MKKILLILAVLIMIALFIKLVRNQAIVTNNEADESLKNLNLELTGIVKAKKDLGHGVHRVFLDVRSSNIQYYHPQDSLQFYLCTIDKNEAELIVSNENDFSKGDSVIISSKKDSCYVYDNFKRFKSKWKRYIVTYHVGNGY